LPHDLNAGRTRKVDLIGATPNEIIFAAILIALVLIGTKVGALGDMLARALHRKR